MNIEARVISAVCQHKDIGALLRDGNDQLFTSHKDIAESLVAYYHKYRAVPDASVLQERFKDFEPEPVTSPTEYYIDQLRNQFVENGIRETLRQAGTDLKEKTGTQTLANLQKSISQLSRMTTTVRDVDITDFEQAEQYMQDVRARSLEHGGQPGMMTGFKSIDSAYHTGMGKGHLIVVIGWPGKAKTWFSTKVACNVWSQGYVPMIVSLEMSPENMRERVYTVMGEGTFRASEFSRGTVSLDDFHSYGRKHLAGKQPFVVVSNEGAADVTPATIQAKIDQHKPDIVIVDYHQLMNDNRRSTGETERNRNISRELKLLANSNNIPIIDITAATMNELSDREAPPMLSQVAWSKAIEYDADHALAVHRHDTDTPDGFAVIEVVNRKNRHGDDYAFFLEWDINSGVVRESFGN